MHDLQRPESVTGGHGGANRRATTNVVATTVGGSGNRTETHARATPAIAARARNGTRRIGRGIGVGNDLGGLCVPGRLDSRALPRRARGDRPALVLARSKYLANDVCGTTPADPTPERNPRLARRYRRVLRCRVDIDGMRLGFSARQRRHRPYRGVRLARANRVDVQRHGGDVSGRPTTIEPPASKTRTAAAPG